MMVDVHCHLNFHSFEDDYDEVAKHAFESGVRVIVNTGTSIPSSRRAVELAQKYDSPAGEMYAIVGVHPHHADKADVEFEGELQSNWFDNLKKLAREPKVIGIGEIGLDYHTYKSNGIVDKDMQFGAFKKQIGLSIELGLPLQIHNRQAGEDIIQVLKKYRTQLQDPPGMFHCFAGSFEVLKDALSLGFYIGFDGNITYKGLAPGETVGLWELAKLTPADRILVETDSPYLTPIPLRGQRNEPKNVIIISEYLASLKAIELGTFKSIINKNVKKVFPKISF
ncbi:MAG: hypothetical protein A3G66_02765 [Candidatus Levybacteria bacterium RIFCSPLOWO2_12_FULL_39_17]|nr:MAG: hypothetical protein A3G66_02765 [Candidatus Levybacteria bacterium RIFCSPLOWO2_12_FULL_39_17]